MKDFLKLMLTSPADHGILRYEMGYASAIAVLLFIVMVLFKDAIGKLLGQD